MSINYEVYKNNNSKNSAYGKYFGRVVIKSIVDTDTLADLIQQNVSVKESDVYGSSDISSDAAVVQCI